MATYPNKKTKIMGIMPLYITTHERVSNNMELYIDSIAPHLVPGGGDSLYNNTR